MSQFLTMEEFLGMNTEVDTKSEWKWERKDVIIPIRSVPGDIYFKARKAAMKMSVTGRKKSAERKVEFDELKLKSEIIIAAIDKERTNFHLDSAQVLAKYNKVAACDVVPCVFTPREINDLYEKIESISDFSTDEEEEEDVKN